MSNRLIRIKRINELILLADRIKSRLVLPKRLKGGRIERLVGYGKSVLNDYRQAIKDSYEDSLENRTKTYCYLSLIGLFTYLYKTNPSPNSFESELINYQNIMSTIGEPIRNANCYSHLNELNDLDNKRMLSKINLLFLTIFIRKEFSSNLKIYPANCKYLQPTYLDYLTDRIVDIGIANRWILLNRKLKDFDINPDEWKEQ